MINLCTLQLSPTSSSMLVTDEDESVQLRIVRLLSESPVMIVARSSTSSSTRCMCHVLKNLLATIGVHPTVVELEEDEMKALPEPGGDGDCGPEVYIGGKRVGGLERVVALHLSGQLVPKLVEVGAMKKDVAVACVYGVGTSIVIWAGGISLGLSHKRIRTELNQQEVTLPDLSLHTVRQTLVVPPPRLIFRFRPAISELKPDPKSTSYGESVTLGIARMSFG